MRLSEWRVRSPAREAMTAAALAVVEPVLEAPGAGRDPDCWVAWGEEPASGHVILVPTPVGLVTCHVRANLPQEGPRASGGTTARVAGSDTGRRGAASARDG